MYKITIRNGSRKSIIHEPAADSDRRLKSGSFKDEVNAIPSATLTMLPQNPEYNSIRAMTTEVEITNVKTGATEWEGRVMQAEETMDSTGIFSKKITCEGYMGYLCDSRQTWHEYPNGTTVAAFLQGVLNVHNSMVSEEKRIYLGQCDVQSTASRTTGYGTTLSEINTLLIDRLGGEIRVYRGKDGLLYLDYVQQYGSRSDVKVALARNLQQLTIGTDATSIITRLIPLGCQLNDETAERLTIESVNGGCPYIDDEEAMAKYGVICGTYEWDDVTLPENLIRKGREYLAENNRVKTSYRGTVLDLSVIGLDAAGFAVGNTYRFTNSVMGLDDDLRITKKTTDIYQPYKPSVEIGDKLETATDISVRMQHYVDYEAPQQKIELLQSAKATATALINAGINGYVVVNPNEILVMDTPDKTTASKVWRWSSGGFGYSSTGYNGTYGTAMTMDGAIVADFITAGVLRGIEIANGEDTFHVAPDGTVTASAINITGGTIHITTGSENYDVIELNSGGWHAQLSPLQWLLKNDGIDSSILAQAGAMCFYQGSEMKMQLSADGVILTYGGIWTSGNITSAATVSGDVVVCSECKINGTNVMDALNAIYERLDKGGL
jgi:phage minor structural protein